MRAELSGSQWLSADFSDLLVMSCRLLVTLLPLAVPSEYINHLCLALETVITRMADIPPK
jgi:hypothetical protein